MKFMTIDNLWQFAETKANREMKKKKKMLLIVVTNDVKDIFPFKLSY